MKTQADTFTAVMNNFKSAIEAFNTAQDAEGSAMEENSRAMESLAVKANMLKAQFQELVLGDGGLSFLIKLLIDIGTAILKFANSDLGQLIIKVTLLTTTLNLLNKGFKLVSTNIVSAVKQFLAYQTALVAGSASTTAMYTSTQLLVGGLSNLIKVWATSPFGIATIAVAGIFAIKEIVDALTVSLEEQQEKLNEAKDAYTNASSEVESTSKQLEEVKSKIEEINSLGGTEVSKDGELEKLESQKTELEAILAIEQERERLAKKEYEEEAEKTVYKEVTDSDAFEGRYYYDETGAARYDDPSGNRVEAVKNLSNSLVDLKNKMLETKQAQASLAESGKTNTSEYKNLERESKNLQDEYDKLSDKAIGYADDLSDAVSELDSSYDIYNDVYDALEELNGAIDYNNGLVEDSENTLSDEGEIAEDTSNKIESLGQNSYESFTAMNEATSEQQDRISDLASSIDTITSAYQTAVDALYEYNQQGYLSVDTYSQLMSIAPEYLAMMINENGQLYNNANGVMTLYQARVYEMGVAAARAQINLAASMAGEPGTYAAIGQAAYNAADGVWALVDAELAEQTAKMDSQADVNALNAKIQAIKNLTESTAANAKTTVASIQPTNASTAATKKNTGARKGNADATKAQTAALKAQKEALEAEADALEKQLDDYETVIDYVKDLLKEEQEAVEEEKDAQLEAIQDKIDALEEEQEVFEENIEAQIDALEKQRDETEEYWDAQIDAINDANDALEENMRLQELQEALASAKSQKVKVLKGGRFVYAEDEEAISKAEQELADYEMELAVQRQIEELERLKEEALASLDKQLEELEDYRDKTNDNYEQQLEDLQNYYDKVEAEYDKRIQQYDDWLEQFEDMLEASSKRHAQILYNELVGEQGNWDARIKALSTFVKNYEAKKNQLDGIKSQIEAIDDKIKALESSSASSLSTMNNRLSNAKSLQNQISSIANSTIKKLRAYVLDKENNRVYATKRYNKFEDAWDDADAWMKKNKKMLGEGAGILVESEYYAKGTYSTPEDQIALVADPMRPSNRELVVGSKINQGDGILTSLKKGTGVIPAGRNLTENLVNLARWSSGGGFERTFTTMNQSSSKVVHIDNINLPEVKNGEDFVQYLELNFVNDSIQNSNIRE